MEAQNVQRRKRNLRKSTTQAWQEEPLHQQTAWLKAVFDGIPEAVVILDHAGRLINFNQQATVLLGQEPEDIEPEAWPETYGFFLEDEKTPYPSESWPVMRALRGESMDGEEMILQPKNKETGIWISMSAQPLTRPVDGVHGVIVVFRDVSLRKRIELSRERHIRRVEALYQFSQDLAEGGLDLEKILNTVVIHISQAIGDACVITLWEDSKLRAMAAEHPQTEARALLRELTLAQDYDVERGIIGKVVKSGEPLLIPIIPDEVVDTMILPAYAQYVRIVGIQSLLVVPVKGRHGVLGTIGLTRDRGGKPYTVGDQSFLTDIAHRASLAIENSTLFDSLLEEMEERMSAQKAQEESEERLRSIFEFTSGGIKVLDLEGLILQTNPAFQEMVGYSAAELFGRHFSGLIYASDLTQSIRHFDSLIQGELRELRFEHRLRHKDGSLVWVYTIFTIVKKNSFDQEPAFVVGMVENVTEQKKVEFELAEVKSRFLEGLETERLRLAQDLHDGPMQDLHSATYLLASMEAVEPLYRERLESVGRVIQEVITDLRAVAKELRPPSIMNFGLAQAIRSHAEDQKEKYPDLKFDLDLDSDGQLLSEEVRLTLFRVYQNSLANVIRHAGANEISVYFSLEAEEVRLNIEDNGKGFEVPPRWILLTRQGHFGLAGAAERVAALGGTFKVDSQPGNGTRVRVRLSLPTHPDA